MDPPFPARKILILDDNAIDRETCQRFLTQRAPAGSYHFIGHGSIEGSLELTVREKPDCILLDYHFHDGEGLEFLRALHAEGHVRDHPVVMLTGLGSESIAVEVMKTGVQDYLVKDHLTPDMLFRAVEGAIFKAGTARIMENQRLEMARLLSAAQLANARKDHFLATLSHELRTPLTPVLAAVTMLEEGVADAAELRELTSVIRRNIELEARLIDDLLDLTRIATGKLEVNLKPVDIRDVIRSALHTCQEDISRHQLRVVQNFQASGHMVSGDEPRLLQVFWNLFKNAAKFTPEAGTISVETHDVADGWLEVRVRDTGMGIPPGDLESIFQSFEQGGSSVTKRFGGLGLGLAICRALLDAHGGNIRADHNGQERGAEFFVRLKSQSSPMNGTPPETGETAVTHSEFQARVVLVVEDHEDSALFFCRIIRRLGHHVMAARSAAEARTLFSNHHIDCIVSDIGLPDGNGNELIRQLHAIRPVPAIALSGYGMEEDLQRSREAGFSHHLVKPVRSQSLTHTLTTLFAQNP